MVHDHPVLALFHECEALTRRQSLGFAVFDIRERVVAGVDSGAAINADQLLAECDLETGQDLDPLRTRTILPVTPPFPSNSCACLASTSGNRCAISGLIFCCLRRSSRAIKSCRKNAGLTRLSHWMLYGTTRFRPGRSQPPA